MAKKRGRPKQKNFSYYPHDVFAHQDRKLRKVMRKYGPTASAVFTELLSVIYRGEGYFCKVDYDLYEDIAEAIFCPDTETVEKIIDDFVKAGLFDESIYKRSRILTSQAVQKRVRKMAVWRDYEFDSNLLLISLDADSDDDDEELFSQSKNVGKKQCNSIYPEDNANLAMGNSNFPNGNMQFPCLKEKRNKNKINNNNNPSTNTQNSAFKNTGKLETSLPPSPPPQNNNKIGENPIESGNATPTSGNFPFKAPSAVSSAFSSRGSINTLKGANGDSRGNSSDFRELAKNDPIYRVLVAWNERFEGTAGFYSDFDLSEMLKMRIGERLKTDSLETIIRVIEFVRREYDLHRQKNNKFVWTLNALFFKKSTFDLNKELALREERQRLGNQRSVAGYSDPATYASAEEWTNFKNQRKDNQYANSTN